MSAMCRMFRHRAGKMNAINQVVTLVVVCSVSIHSNYTLVALSEELNLDDAWELLHGKQAENSNIPQYMSIAPGAIPIYPIFIHVEKRP